MTTHDNLDPPIGTMKAAASSKKKDGKLDLGDFLGRSKDGFQPLRQDDDEDDEGLRGNSVHLSSDESDLEDFSVPTMRA